MWLVVFCDSGAQDLYADQQLYTVSRCPSVHSPNRVNFYIGCTNMREAKEKKGFLFAIYVPLRSIYHLR